MPHGRGRRFGSSDRPLHELRDRALAATAVTTVFGYSWFGTDLFGLPSLGELFERPSWWAKVRGFPARPAASVLSQGFRSDSWRGVRGSALERGGEPRLMEDGKQRRDFVHVTDVAACNALAIAADHAGFAAANVCSGEPHTIGDLATELAAAMGGKPPVVVGGARPGDVRHVVADPALARRMLGFRAEVRFADGVAAFATDPLRDPAGLPDQLRSGRNTTDR